MSHRQVEVAEPVDVPALRAWLRAHAVPGVDVVTETSAGTRVQREVATAHGQSPLLLTLPPRGSVVVRAEGRGADEALAVGRRWIGLDLDVAAGVAALGDDPVLGPLVTARPDVRVPGAPDSFEAAVDVVLGQHVSVAAGRVFAGRLAAAYPRRPDVLAAVDPVALRAAVGITGGRATTVVALARACAEGLDLSPTGDPGARAVTRRALLALPGVGPWTADLVALRCLRDPDVFLPGDLVLRRALGGVTAREAAAAAEAWRPHRSLAVVHLWTHHALDPRS